MPRIEPPTVVRVLARLHGAKRQAASISIALGGVTIDARGLLKKRAATPAAELRAFARRPVGDYQWRLAPETPAK